MAELFIFTIFATIIAIYSVLPRYRQLRIGYSLYKRAILALTCVFLLLTVATYIANLYLQHREVESLGSYPIPYMVVNLDPLAINVIQLVSVSAIFAMFVTTIMKSNVRIRNEEYLLSTLRGLYNRSEFATLAEVIGDNYKPQLTTRQNLDRQLLSEMPQLLKYCLKKTIHIQIGRCMKQKVRIDLPQEPGIG